MLSSIHECPHSKICLLKNIREVTQNGTLVNHSTYEPESNKETSKDTINTLPLSRHNILNQVFTYSSDLCLYVCHLNKPTLGRVFIATNKIINSCEYITALGGIRTCDRER